MTRKSLLLIALVGIILAALPPTSAKACVFCNPNAYSNCGTTTGTYCSGEGTSKPCIAYGCYCEFGTCLCQGGTWQCHF